MTQTELVRSTNGNLTAGHLGQVETGDRGMSPEKVAVVADALALTKAERAELEEAARAYRQRGRLDKAAARSGVQIPDELTPDEAATIQAAIDKVVRRRSG